MLQLVPLLVTDCGGSSSGATCDGLLRNAYADAQLPSADTDVWEVMVPAERADRRRGAWRTDDHLCKRAGRDQQSGFQPRGAAGMAAFQSDRSGPQGARGTRLAGDAIEVHLPPNVWRCAAHEYSTEGVFVDHA